MSGRVDARTRRMEESDIAAVAALDTICQGHPWVSGHFRDELARGDEGFARVMVDSRDEIVGFVCCWVVLDEMHVGTISVDPAARRGGLGKSMISQAHEWAVGRGATAAHLEVRAGNVGAIAMYESMGYRRVGVRRGYYADNGEDAVLYFAELSTGSIAA